MNTYKKHRYGYGIPDSMCAIARKRNRSRHVKGIFYRWELQKTGISLPTSTIRGWYVAVTAEAYRAKWSAPC